MKSMKRRGLARWLVEILGYAKAVNLANYLNNVKINQDSTASDMQANIAGYCQKNYQNPLYFEQRLDITIIQANGLMTGNFSPVGHMKLHLLIVMSSV